MLITSAATLPKFQSSNQLAICAHKSNAGGGAVDNLCPQSQQRYVILANETTRIESK